MTDPICFHHSGIEKELKAICGKVDLRFGDMNRRVEQLEKLVLRVGILEQGGSYISGGKRWSDYIITVIIAGAIVLLSKLLHL